MDKVILKMELGKYTKFEASISIEQNSNCPIKLKAI
jgi:hypothetical protein